MKKFWNWIKNEDSTRTLYLEGAIADESWFDDDITPKQFKAELTSGEGDITVWINSSGGDCAAASQIYNMLMDYKGNVTVQLRLMELLLVQLRLLQWLKQMCLWVLLA